MAFDGQDHRGASLIYPIHYHPQAPMAGHVLNGSLRIAYFCARRAQRFLIASHYPRNLQAPATGRDRPDRVSSTSWVGVCDGYRVVPTASTHITAHAAVGVQPIMESTLSVRLVVYREVASTAWAIASNVLTITVASGHGFTAGQQITFDTVTAAGDVSTATTISSVTATTIVLPKTAADASATEAGTVTGTDTGSATEIRIAPPVAGTSSAEPPSDPVAAALAAVASAVLNTLVTPDEIHTAECGVALSNCTAGYTLRVQVQAKCVSATSVAVSWRPYHAIAWSEVRG